jgi:U3 small nucleolar RNA-associated protein 25
MQNFEHVGGVLSNLNKIPRHQDCVNNFQDIRPYFNENLGKFYRQNIVYTDYNFPELNDVIIKYFNNFEGCLREKIWYEPVVRSQTHPHLNFEFVRIDVDDAGSELDKKFNFFVNNVWDTIRKKD